MREVIAVLLAQPDVANDTDLGLLENIEIRGIELLRELIRHVQAHPNATGASLIEHWSGRPEQQHMTKLLQSFPLESEHELQAQFDDLISRIAAHAVRQRREALLGKQQSNGLSEEEKAELRTLLAARAQ